MIRFKSLDPDRPKNYPDLTPLIDMVFILLIFFLLTSSALRFTALEVIPPSSKQAASTSSLTQVVGITLEGTVLFAGRAIALSDLQQLLDPQEKVYIQADRMTPLQLVVDVLNELGRLNAHEVLLLTDKDDD